MNVSVLRKVKLNVLISGERRRIHALKESIIPESKRGRRCKLTLSSSQSDRKLVLTFESKDAVSIRASFNTNLRLVSSALKAVESGA